MYAAEQQRIAGQKEPDQQSGLGEHHGQNADEPECRDKPLGIENIHAPRTSTVGQKQDQCGRSPCRPMDRSPTQATRPVGKITQQDSTR
jgi:hypothetical protein